ncbi:MAG: hypothetical protein VYA06_04500, partial [Chloroflexota bacterium]|nr:hypothetical protein [Chloroflexota bacterium]
MPRLPFNFSILCMPSNFVMSKNLNNKKDNDINKIELSTISNTIHIPINSSITTKLGSFNSALSFSNLKFVEIKPIGRIINKIINRTKNSIFSPKIRIIKHANKLQKVPDPILI